MLYRYVFVMSAKPDCTFLHASAHILGEKSFGPPTILSSIFINKYIYWISTSETFFFRLQTLSKGKKRKH